MIVVYTVNYNTDECPSLDSTTEPGPIVLHVPKGINGDQIMKIAADKDKKYQFSADYYKDLGFFITAINGIKVDKAQDLNWELYCKAPEDDDFVCSQVGTSSLEPFNGLVIKFLYQHPRKC